MRVGSISKLVSFILLVASVIIPVNSVKAGEPWGGGPSTSALPDKPGKSQKCETILDSSPSIPDPDRTPSGEEGQTILPEETSAKEQLLPKDSTIVQIPWIFWLDLLTQIFN